MTRSWSATGVEVDEVAEPRERRREHVVEVERCGKRLGDAVEREEQRVGFGQPAHAVDRERAAGLDLAEQAARVPGDERDEEQLDRPLRGVERGCRSSEFAREDVVGDGDAEGHREGGAHREREPPREARGHDRGEQAEDERRAPVAGAHDRPDVEGDLGEDRDDAPELAVVVVERPEGAPQRVAQQHEAPDETSAS